MGIFDLIKQLISDNDIDLAANAISVFTNFNGMNFPRIFFTQYFQIGLSIEISYNSFCRY